MKPFQPAAAGIITDKMVRDLAEARGMSIAEALASLEELESRCRYYTNDIYQVRVHDLTNVLVHLNIRRRDGKPIFRDWRHFQQIKNELVGPECEAIELYPAESRLVDEANKYHLFAFKDPTYRVPVGWKERCVYDDLRGAKAPGLKQRKLPGIWTNP